MLKRYKAPDGTCWLFDEGRQPDGYEPAEEPKPEQPKTKARAPRNKARAATKAK